MALSAAAAPAPTPVSAPRPASAAIPASAAAAAAVTGAVPTTTRTISTILAEQLDGLTLHSSPPPALLARFAEDYASHAAAGAEPSGPLEEGRRSPPAPLRDPEAALHTFIEHLLSSDHAESQPHLLAIGYELEALLSMYPGSVKLSVSSRPSSMIHALEPEPEPVSDTATVPAPASASTATATSASAAASASAAGLASASALTSASASAPAFSAPMGKRQTSQAWTDAVADEALGLATGERIRYEVSLPAWEDGDAPDGYGGFAVSSSADGGGLGTGVDAGAGAGAGEKEPEAPRLRVLVSLPPTYPNSSPPQLQLLGRYVGSYSIDAGLFGDITRTYITSSGVPFTPGDVCVFEGLTHVQALVRAWYAAHLAASLSSEAERAKQLGPDAMSTSLSSLLSRTSTPPSDMVTPTSDIVTSEEMRPSSSRASFSYSRREKTDGTQTPTPTPSAVTNAEAGLPAGLAIVSSHPIHDRKSTFVGHAIRVTDEREVPLVIHELLSDKKIAKAAHPAIFAYRIVKDVGGVAGRVINADYDDDGESAAGARLAHLLEILELENVLVVVSRWFGGTLLGSDRFKHISQAAREALEAAGFLDDREKETEPRGGNKRRGKR